MSVQQPPGSALVAFVPARAARRIDKWRRLYDPNVAIVAPHITVLYPFSVPDVERSSVVRALRGLVAAHPPFEVVLDGLEFFEDNPEVLWLKPEDGGNFAQIHKAIAEQCPQYAPPADFEYVPHLTVGFFDSHDALEAARKVILAEWMPIRFWVRTLIFVAREDHGVWGVHRRLRLGRHSAW